MKFLIIAFISIGVISNLPGGDLEEEYQKIWQNKSIGIKIPLRIPKTLLYESTQDSFTVYNDDIAVYLLLRFRPLIEYGLDDLKRYNKSSTESMLAGNWKIKSVTDFNEDNWQIREIYGFKTEKTNNYICVLMSKKNFFLIISAMSNKLEDYKICKKIIQEIISNVSITSDTEHRENTSPAGSSKFATGYIQDKREK